MKCLSCASGPALEGGHITHGAWAVPGAVDRVGVITAAFHSTPSATFHPIRLCRSGILDAIAGLVRLGIINRKGNLVAGRDTVPAY